MTPHVASEIQMGCTNRPSPDRRTLADGEILALLRNAHGLLFAGVPARMLAFV